MDNLCRTDLESVKPFIGLIPKSPKIDTLPLKIMILEWAYYAMEHDTLDLDKQGYCELITGISRMVYDPECGFNDTLDMLFELGIQIY